VSDGDRRKSGKDDGLALAALLVGVAGAFMGRRVMLELAAGVSLAIGGAIAALRGGRPLSHRGLLSVALVAAGFGLICALGLELYQEWVTGQWLAEGAPVGQQGDELKTLARTLSIVRIVALAGGLSFVLGALVDRLSPPPKQ
jgi:hypothetical protein